MRKIKLTETEGVKDRKHHGNLKKNKQTKNSYYCNIFNCHVN